MAAQDTDGNRIVSQCMLAPRAPGESPLRFVKHIGKQKLGVDTLLFRRAQHFILVRNPLHVIKSYVKVLAPTLQELGYTGEASGSIIDGLARFARVRTCHWWRERCVQWQWCFLACGV